MAAVAQQAAAAGKPADATAAAAGPAADVAASAAAAQQPAAPAGQGDVQMADAQPAVPAAPAAAAGPAAPAAAAPDAAQQPAAQQAEAQQEDLPAFGSFTAMLMEEPAAPAVSCTAAGGNPSGASGSPATFRGPARLLSGWSPSVHASHPLRSIPFSCLQAAAPAAAAAEPEGAEPAAPAAVPPAVNTAATAVAPAAATAAAPPMLPNGLGQAAPSSPNQDASVARVASLSNWIPPTAGSSPSPRSRPPAIAEGTEAP